MKKIYGVVIFALISVMIFSGYQCSSTELTSAKLYIQQKNLDKALDALEKEVAKNPKSDEGYYLMGYIYGEKEETDKMLEAFGKSLSVSNKFEKDIKGAKKSYWANNYNKAVGFYNRALQSTSEDTIKLNFDKAIFSFKQAIAAEPDSADTYKTLGFVYLNLQDLDSAIPVFQKTVDLKKSYEGYRYLGEIYYTQGANLVDTDSLAAVGKYNKAIEILEAGRKVYPDSSELLLTLSNSYIGANKIDVAIDAFKSGVEKEPGNKYYRYNYGVLLLGANKFDEASIQFKEALNIDPDYENAAYNLAVTYVKWGARLAKEAEDKGEDITAAKEKYKEGLPYLVKYTELKGNDVPALELLAKVYAILGDSKKAEEIYKKIDDLR
ncbi:MAG: tetratricopeptide repeat protein [Ignavibacteriales bacterium]|nr:tetratricopeptide repeat protein [Ignavibacteriales bacterium]